MRINRLFRVHKWLPVARATPRMPAWTAFTRSVGNSGDVGTWHETYLVSPDACETIYHNMPRFGLGRVGKLVPATGRFAHAHERMQKH